MGNPPFSQNYSLETMKFKERFRHFMPESGKKADLMFVQHMVASLRSDGRMAVVMPHGVLFRGGEEKACRQQFIKDGILEAVIGLPSNLFYGTGIPVAEIDSLSDFFTNYDGVKDAIFVGWTFLSDTPPTSISAATSKSKRSDGQECPSYADFSPTITAKDQIKAVIESAPGLRTKHAAFQKVIAGWWKKNLAEIERLPETKNVFELRRHCIDSLARTLTSQGILTTHQVRGSVAGYIKTLESDLQSIAASGWGAELIPEEQILQSQFPEVLEQIEKDQTRIAELEGLYAAANETEDEDADPENVDTENGVLPKALVTSSC